MRKHISNSHCRPLLRRLMSTTVLASAGWLAVVPAADAQSAADPGVTQVPLLSATAAGAPVNETSNTVARNETDTKTVAFHGVSAPEASVNVADASASEVAFVTDTAVTRYDTAYDTAALDDRVLDHQRGRAVGMIMVAATPNAFRNNSVTLWDEIGPPVQTPQPSDAARAQTGNIVTYNRK
jgi:hypothetical protein